MNYLSSKELMLNEKESVDPDAQLIHLINELYHQLESNDDTSRTESSVDITKFSKMMAFANNRSNFSLPYDKLKEVVTPQSSSGSSEVQGGGQATPEVTEAKALESSPETLVHKFTSVLMNKISNGSQSSKLQDPDSLFKCILTIQLLSNYLSSDPIIQKYFVADKQSIEQMHLNDYFIRAFINQATDTSVEQLIIVKLAAVIIKNGVDAGVNAEWFDAKSKSANSRGGSQQRRNRGVTFYNEIQNFIKQNEMLKDQQQEKPAAVYAVTDLENVAVDKRMKYMTESALRMSNQSMQMGHQNIARVIESSPYGEIQRPVERKYKKRPARESLQPIKEMSYSKISLPSVVQSQQETGILFYVNNQIKSPALINRLRQTGVTAAEAHMGHRKSKYGLLKGVNSQKQISSLHQRSQSDFQQPQDVKELNNSMVSTSQEYPNGNLRRAENAFKTQNISPESDSRYRNTTRTGMAAKSSKQSQSTIKLRPYAQKGDEIASSQRQNVGLNRQSSNSIWTDRAYSPYTNGQIGELDKLQNVRDLRRKLNERKSMQDILQQRDSGGFGSMLRSKTFLNKPILGDNYQNQKNYFADHNRVDHKRQTTRDLTNNFPALNSQKSSVMSSPNTEKYLMPKTKPGDEIQPMLRQDRDNFLKDQPQIEDGDVVYLQEVQVGYNSQDPIAQQFKRLPEINGVQNPIDAPSDNQSLYEEVGDGSETQNSSTRSNVMMFPNVEVNEKDRIRQSNVETLEDLESIKNLNQVLHVETPTVIDSDKSRQIVEVASESITSPKSQYVVIESLIQDQNKTLEQKLTSRLQALNENTETNLTNMYTYLSKKLKSVVEKQEVIIEEVNEQSQTPRQKGISGVTYIEELIDHKLQKKSKSLGRTDKNMTELEKKVALLTKQMTEHFEVQSQVNNQQNTINDYHVEQLRKHKVEINNHREYIESIEHQWSINKIGQENQFMEMTAKQDQIIKSNDLKDTKVKVEIQDKLDTAFDAIESKLKEFGVSIQDRVKMKQDKLTYDFKEVFKLLEKKVKIQSRTIQDKIAIVDMHQHRFNIIKVKFKEFQENLTTCQYMHKTIGDYIDEQRQQLHQRFHQMFEYEIKKQNFYRIQGYSEIDHNAKAYFTSWLNSNAIGSFRQEITKKSQVKHDWISLAQFCSQIRYYNFQTIQIMVNFLKSKWILSSVDFEDPELEDLQKVEVFKKFKKKGKQYKKKMIKFNKEYAEEQKKIMTLRPTDKWVNFQHTSCFALKIFTQLNQYMKDQRNIKHVSKSVFKPQQLALPGTDPHVDSTTLKVMDPLFQTNFQMITKICLSLEMYCYNKQNLFIVEKLKGVTILMDILIYHNKLFVQVESQEQEQITLRKQFYTTVLRTLAVCLRANFNIKEFVEAKDLNFLRLFKFMQENLYDEDIVLECLLVLKQILNNNPDTYTVIDGQWNLGKINILFSKLITIHIESLPIFEVVMLCMKQVISQGKAYDDKKVCANTLAEILMIFKKQEANDLDLINKMLDKLMATWSCENLSDFSDAMFYESKFFAGDIRILTYTDIGIEYELRIRLHLKQVNTKFVKVQKQLEHVGHHTEIIEDVDSDITLGSDSDESDESDEDYGLKVTNKLEADAAEKEKNKPGPPAPPTVIGTGVSIASAFFIHVPKPKDGEKKKKKEGDDDDDDDEDLNGDEDEEDEGAQDSDSDSDEEGDGETKKKKKKKKDKKKDKKKKKSKKKKRSSSSSDDSEEDNDSDKDTKKKLKKDKKDDKSKPEKKVKREQSPFEKRINGLLDHLKKI